MGVRQRSVRGASGVSRPAPFRSPLPSPSTAAESNRKPNSPTSMSAFGVAGTMPVGGLKLARPLRQLGRSGYPGSSSPRAPGVAKRVQKGHFLLFLASFMIHVAGNAVRLARVEGGCRSVGVCASPRAPWRKTLRHIVQNAGQLNQYILGSLTSRQLALLVREYACALGGTH
jgi:hypothetical protein